MAETTETLILDIQFDSNEAIKETTALKNEIIKLKDANKEILKTEGQVTDQYVKNVAQIKVYSSEVATNERALTNQAKAALAAKGSNEQLKAQLSVLTAEYNKLSKEERENSVAGQVLQQTIKGITDTLKGSEGDVGNFRRNVGDYEGAFTRASNSIEGMKARIAELQSTIQTADVGSKEFKEAADEASNLQLSVDQALGKVNEFGEREPKNNVKKNFGDALITVGLLGQGINALSEQFTDNENAQENLAKATQGVSVALAFANVIKEKGAILDTLNATTTGAAAAAQGAYTLAVGISSGALKAFRLALIGTGIGAIIVALGFLIANFEDITNAVKDFLGLSSEQERASKALQENYSKEADRLGFLVSLEERRISSVDKVYDRQIKLAKAAGKDTLAIEERKAAAYQKTTNIIIGQLQAQLAQGKAANVSAKEQIALGDKIKDLQSNLLDSQNDIESKRIAKSTKATDDALKNAEKVTADNKAANEKRKADNEKAAQDELNIARQLTASRIALVEDERLREIIALRTANEQRIADITSNSEQAKFLKQSITEETEKGIFEINEKYRKQESDAQAAALETEKARILERQQAELDAITKRQEKVIQRYQFEEAQRQLGITNEEAALIQTTEGLFNLAAIEQANGVTRQQIVDDYYTFFDERGEISFEQYLALLQEQVAITQAANEQQTAAAMAFGEQVGAIFAETLNEQGQELKGFGRKFLILILDTLKKTVLSNIATAATSSLAQPDSVATFGASGAIRAGILSAAINAAAGLAISKLSQPPQGFATGVVGLQGAGTATSDSIPAWLSAGESVVTADGTNYAQQNYPGLLEFLNSPNKFATGVVDFQGGAPSAGVGSDTFSVLADAIARIQPVVRVTDINKKQSDYSEVRVTGTLT